MALDPTPDRRTVLKTLGAAGALGSIGTASAKPPRDDDLRLFSEQAADNAMEVVTQKNYAYVATGDGMAIVDWRDPGRPELVAKIEASEPEEIGGDDEGSVGGILDVKVDGDVAAMAHNGGNGITTVDVSDPENPEELAFYDTESGIHNCFLYEDHAYLTVNASRIVADEEGLGLRFFGNAGVDIVDVSDPSNPERAAIWYLRDELPAYANAGTNPNHDIYVQDDLAYNVFWDAGCVVLDVDDPSAPEFVAQFGETDEGDTEIRPWRFQREEFADYINEVFPAGRYLGNPGNAHYVQPSQDGKYTFVGDETFPKSESFSGVPISPPGGGYGGIRIFDTSDWNDIEQVGFISPPDEDVGLRTSHNFDVTQNRIHTSWYNGGVRVFDITDPTDPDELGSYNPEGYSFWTAVQARGFTVGGIYGARSEDHAGGVAFLHNDRGRKRAPGFEGSAPPEGPGMGIEPDEE